MPFVITSFAWENASMEKKFFRKIHKIICLLVIIQLKYFTRNEVEIIFTNYKLTDYIAPTKLSTKQNE